MRGSTSESALPHPPLQVTMMPLQWHSLECSRWFSARLFFRSDLFISIYLFIVQNESHGEKVVCAESDVACVSGLPVQEEPRTEQGVEEEVLHSD